MTITVQQLRSAIPGAQPASLDPGQVAFNVSDGTMYLGTGSDVRIDFSGAQVLPAPPAGKGWIQVLLERAALNDFFLPNPESQGLPAPENEQVLTWNANEGKAEWQDAGTGFAYVTTNGDVSVAIGATTSEKISAAIGNPSYIGINASCIVQGDPGTTYEGLYIWDGSEWKFASHYAFNTASQVPAVNPSTLTAASTQEVLNALKAVDDGLQSQITSNDGDISTLQGQVSQAQSDIISLEANKLNIASNTPTAGQILSFDGAGQLWVDDSQGDVTSVTGTGAITVDNTDAQNPIVELQSNAAGDLLVGDGTGSFGKLAIGNPDEVLVVGPGGLPQWQADSPGDVTSVTGVAPIVVDNTDPQTPIVSVDLGTTATPGVLQVELTGNLTLVNGVIDCPDGTTTVKGAVQLANNTATNDPALALTAAAGYDLQGQINALTLAGNVTLAGGYNAATGLVDGVTTQGTAAGFVDGSAPPAASGVADFYLICVVAGSNPSAMENGDWLLSDGANYVVLGVGARPTSASYTTAGIVQLADAAAVLAGTSDTLAITPQALQDNIIDSVTTANSSQIASATAVKTANDNAVAASGAAAAAQATADAALPKAGGTMTGTLTGQDINVQATYAIQFAGGTNGTLDGITDSVVTTDSTVAASATAVSSAFNAAIGANNAAVAAQTTANTALSDASAAQADATQALADASAAQTTADNAIPKATFTAAGELLYGTGAGTYDVLPIGVDNQQLIVSGGALSWGQGLQGFTEVARTALGVGSLDAITSGVDNVAVGYNTGTSLTTGSRNVFIGDECGDGVTSGNNNTVVGSSAFSATGGSNNTVMGYAAGGAMTVGNSNTIIGSSAGDALTGANAVVAIGQAALSGAATATGTVAIGQSSLQNLTTGTSNTAVGYQTGDTLTSGSGNTLLGFNAGTALTLGGTNILIGAQAGDLITTGFNNTIIGDVSGSSSLTGTLILATGTTVRFQANNSGAWSPDGTNYGTAGQVLTSQGDATVPTWSDAPVGLIGFTNGSGEAPYSVALGFGAGDAVAATGFYNVSIGYNAGTNITTGDYNVGVGGSSLQGTGSTNTAVGSSAQGSASSTGQGNSSVGYQTLDALTSGQFNSTIGSASGTSVTSGSRNTLLGYRAGALITTGGSNTILGAYEGTQALSSNIVLSDGDGNVKLQINGPGAWSTNGSSYGTAGQNLTSNGSGAAPTWTTPIWQTVSGSSDTTDTYTLLTLPIASATSVQLYLEARDDTDATYHNDTYYIITDGTSTNVSTVTGARIGSPTVPAVVSASISGTDLLIQITNHDAHLITVQGNYMTTAA